MEQAVFSYIGKRAWKFQDITLTQGTKSCKVSTLNKTKKFDDLYTAIGYLSNITKKHIVFRTEEEWYE